MKRLAALFLSMILFISVIPGAIAAPEAVDVETKVIVVDAGHGGYDGGAVYEGICEKDINLSVAEYLEDILTERGYTVIMTRDSDKYVKLATRAYIANKADADLFVSVHANAAVNAPYFAGVYTYRCPGSRKGLALANAIQDNVCEQTEAIDRGVLSENFYVVRATYMPAVLVEMGFMSNHDELQNLIDPEYQEKIAEGIALGIDEYFE